MYGQSRDQGSDSSNRSRTEPAFFQSPLPVSGSNQPGPGKKNKPVSYRRLGLKPEVGNMLLAVYEAAEEYRAGILLVESVVEITASDCSTCKHGTADSDSRTGNWVGRVAELQLENVHQPGEGLQWAEAFELSSDEILYSEVLVYKLKSEQVAACRSLVSRLRSIAWMLEMSRGVD